MAENDILRTLIPDDAPVFGDGGNEYMFSDEQLGHFLEVGKGNVLRAAAYANYSIASSEALISKVIRTQDLQTNGPQVAEALIKKADALMKRADAEDSAEDFAYFEIIDYHANHGYRPELTEYPWRL